MGFIKNKEKHEIQYKKRKNVRNFAGLLEQLKDNDPETRCWAARDLASYPESVSSLASVLAEETHLNVREAILTSLTLIGGSEAVSELVNFLRSDDASIRNDVIEVMKSMPDAVAPIMSDLLTDADSDVRIFAIDILESLRHPHVEKWLIDVILDDNHVNVCANAVNLLGEIGTDDALAPLKSLKEKFKSVPYIKFAVDMAVNKIQGN